MDAQIVTIISGIVLFIVFALVGVYIRSRSGGRKSVGSDSHKRSGKDSSRQEKKDSQGNGN